MNPIFGVAKAFMFGVGPFEILIVLLMLAVMAGGVGLIVWLAVRLLGDRGIVQTCPRCGTHVRGRPVMQCPNCGARFGQ